MVQIYEVGEYQGLPYLSLEYCSGGTLADRINNQLLQPKEAARLVEVLARAVHKAHQKNVIHRDLKPANVLLTESGEPKITDFGLARRIDDQGGTSLGVVMGTPSYMAPEQASGRPIRWETDVYGLGAILYECLTGRPPFKATSILETLSQVSDSQPVPPSRIQPNIPPDLDAVCLKCLEKEPQHRYASASDLADDLERFHSGKPTLARPVSFQEQVWRWCRRQPVIASLILTVVLAVVTGSAISVYFGVRAGNEATRARSEQRRAEKQRKQAEQREYLATMRLAQLIWNQGDLDRLRQLLKEQIPINRGQQDRRGFEWYYWNRLAHQITRTYTGHEHIVYCLAISPDGKQIASGASGGIIKIWTPSTGADVHTLKSNGPVRCIAYSPKGERLAAGSSDGSLHVWSTKTWKRIWGANKLKDVKDVVFDPKGHYLATSNLTTGVSLWNRTTGALVREFSGPDWGVAFSPDGTKIVGVGRSSDLEGVVGGLVWSTTTGKRVFRLATSTQTRISSVAFSAQGDLIAGAGADGSVKLWSGINGRELPSLPGHQKEVHDVAFSPDGKILASCDFTGIRIWDPRQNELLAVLPVSFRGGFASGTVHAVSFSPSGAWFAASTGYNTNPKWQGDVQIWKLANVQKFRQLDSVIGFQSGLTFNSGGSQVVYFKPTFDFRTRKQTELICFQDVETGLVVNTLASQFDLGQKLVLSEDGRYLATTGHKRRKTGISGPSGVKVWDLTEQRVIQEVEEASCACFSRDGQFLITGDRDQTIRIRSLKTGRILRTGEGHEGMIHAIALSNDGQRIASGGSDRKIILWDFLSSRQLREFRTSEGIKCLAFSPDDKHVVSGGGNIRLGEIKVWDLTTGKQQNLKGHAGVVESVSFSSDGKRIASGSLDQTIKVWEMVTGQEILSLDAKGIVRSVAFSPDKNHRLATAGSDLRVWEGAPLSPAESSNQPKPGGSSLRDTANFFAVLPGLTLLMIVLIGLAIRSRLHLKSPQTSAHVLREQQTTSTQG